MHLFKRAQTFGTVGEMIQGTEKKHDVRRLFFLIQGAGVPYPAAGNLAIQLSSLLNEFWDGVNEMDLVATSGKPGRIRSWSSADIQDYSRGLREPPVYYFFRAEKLQLEDADLEAVALRGLLIIGQNFGRKFGFHVADCKDIKRKQLLLNDIGTNLRETPTCRTDWLGER